MMGVTAMNIESNNIDILKQNIDAYTKYCLSKIDKNNFDSFGTYLTGINRISTYCKLYSKHLVNFTEDEIIKYLIEDAVSTKPIESRAYRADDFLNFLNLSDKYKLKKHIKKASQVWRTKVLNGDDAKIISAETLANIIKRIYSIYPFYQHSLVWILRFHGISYEEIDKLKYSNVDSKNRILTTESKSIYMNDLLLDYIQKCKNEKSFKVMSKGKLRNRSVNHTEYLISGTKSRTSFKNLKIKNRIYRITYNVLNKYKLEDKYLQIFNLLPKAGMLNDFCYNKIILNNKNIIQYLTKYGISKSNIKEQNAHNNRENFKLLYDEYVLKDIKYLPMNSVLLEEFCYDNNTQIGESNNDEELVNEILPMEFNNPEIKYDDNKLEGNTAKYQGRMESGNESEKFVMKQYTNAHYVEDDCGFDIYDKDGKTCIEVKTVNSKNEFIISLRELVCAEKYIDKYMLYLVKYKNDKAYSFMKIYNPIKYFNIDMFNIKHYLKNSNCTLVPRSYTITVK